MVVLSNSSGELIGDELNRMAEGVEAPTGQVTFVFTDIENSTVLWNDEPDAMHESLEIHDHILRELLKAHNGYEVKTEGDAFMVTFGSVVDAIQWCIGVQLELLRAEWPNGVLERPCASVVTVEDQLIFRGIRLRMGVHTGEPNCRRNPVTNRMDYYGPVVNRSARVSSSAQGGQIICTQEVLDKLGTLTEIKVVDLGQHHYKGISEAVRVYQILPSALSHRTFPPIRTINTGDSKAAEEFEEYEDEDEEEDEFYDSEDVEIVLSSRQRLSTCEEEELTATRGESSGGRRRVESWGDDPLSPELRGRAQARSLIPLDETSPSAPPPLPDVAGPPPSLL